MSYYEELNRLYVEKTASPNTSQNEAVVTKSSVAPQKNKMSFGERMDAWNDKLDAFDDKVKAWNEQRVANKREKVYQRQQAKQEMDNQRIEKAHKLQQKLKNPSFKADAPDPKTQDQSLWSAIKGNKPQGGDKSQAINASTSVFANPNNQSSMGSRLLSWGKNNPKAAIGYGTAAAAGIGAAAYGIHKARQLKKKREQEKNQQSAYPQMMMRTAFEELDGLYLEKLASAEVEDVAESIPSGVQDDASMIEKIQESVKYTKKEDVPGGKSAPSRLVQRKNKERFRR